MSGLSLFSSPSPYSAFELLRDVDQSASERRIQHGLPRCHIPACWERADGVIVVGTFVPKDLKQIEQEIDRAVATAKRCGERANKIMASMNKCTRKPASLNNALEELSKSSKEEAGYWASHANAKVGGAGPWDS